MTFSQALKGHIERAYDDWKAGKKPAERQDPNAWRTRGGHDFVWVAGMAGSDQHECRYCPGVLGIGNPDPPETCPRTMNKRLESVHDRREAQCR